MCPNSFTALLDERAAEVTLPEMLWRASSADPYALALIDDDRCVTRAELVSGAERVAADLLSAGAGRGERVGLLHHPGAEAVIAAWGILLAGCAYVPMSPDYPADRLRFMAEDSGIRFVVCEEHSRRTLSMLALQLTAVVATSTATAMASATESAPTIEPAALDDAAYVIYTSGSTGLPKGVVVDHRAIATQLLTLAARGWLTAHGRILQKTPLSFDAAQWELLASATGAVVVCGDQDTCRDPHQLIERVRRHDVTHLQCVPTLWQAITQTNALSSCTTLRHVFSGGEALTHDLAARIRSAVPEAELVNLYGPTEVTINALAEVVTASPDAGEAGEERDAPGIVPIGLPLDSVSALVLDAQGRLVPPGSRGELHLGGPQLAQGYLDRDALTAERFVMWVTPEGERQRLYRTGDIVSVRADGRFQFHGRSDHQVKINGYRIELDEVAATIRQHHWVRDVAVVPWRNPNTGHDQIAAFVELDPHEAALMDQGEHGGHHATKATHVQVRAQLAEPAARRDLTSTPSLDLPPLGPGETEALAELAYRRKTYRSYRGDPVSREEVLEWLADPTMVAPSAPAGWRPDTFEGLSWLLRWLGPFDSSARLLPKYAYASPGALYGVQIYLEAVGVQGLGDGVYYFHPRPHMLTRLAASTHGEPCVKLHLVGSRRAIRTVYSTNVDEVLHFEAGHLLGALDQALSTQGTAVQTASARDVGDVGDFALSSDDHVYLTAVDITLPRGEAPRRPISVHLQVSVSDHHEAAGTYAVFPGPVRQISDGVVRRRDVIAINQASYRDAQLGVSLTVPRHRGWPGLIDLGRALHHLQANDRGIGLLSAGYSSLTGRDLPAARRFNELCGDDLVYFALGGPISEDQLAARDMSEDAVHTRGPEELLRDDMAAFLPAYMMPSVVRIVPRIPLTPNGKRDVPGMQALAAETIAQRPLVPPANDLERAVLEEWGAALDVSVAEASVHDDFFAQGGDSLTAVALIERLNRRFGSRLPIQSVFDAPTPAALAALLHDGGPAAAGRLIKVSDGDSGGARRPRFAWPGLGGFPMNLRDLAQTFQDGRDFFGVQAVGVNHGERPHRTIAEMAADDLELIRQHQPEGPYTLIGYSFGSRVAFEVARRLESMGEIVESLTLIAPGGPRTEWSEDPRAASGVRYDNPYFVQILTSVFTRSVDDRVLIERVLSTATDSASYASFMSDHTGLPLELVARLVAVVEATFSARFDFTELRGAPLAAPISIVRAEGDDYSFLDTSEPFSRTAPIDLTLPIGHYALLAPDGARRVHALLSTPPPPGDAMPHVHIKHFPFELDASARSELVAELTAAVAKAFRCTPDVVSIAHEPVPATEWQDKVYIPEISDRPDRLLKAPNYSVA